MAAKLVRKKAGFERIELFKDQIIGIGAFGAVCHAQCDDLPCAAKILHPTIFAMAGLYKNAQQFEQECKFIRTVQHPNIVRYFGVHYDDITGQPVLLMEMMDENLTHFLESSTENIPYHLQVNFCRDIVLALSFLHSNDIIHRNLSGNNVLLICNSRAKVSDFGMARLSSFDPKRSFLAYTMSSTTHVYMPPEGLRNNPKYDEKIDCFSFGVIAVQIMTREFPRPTDRLKPVDTENATAILSYTIIPEIERREGDISKINPNHPLLQIALPCLSNDSAQRPSAQMLCKEVKKLREGDEYRESASGIIKQSRASSEGTSSEKRENQNNQQESDEDAGKSTPNLEQTISNRVEVSKSCIAEEKVEEHHDGAEHPKAQNVIVIAAEVHPMEDETLSEQSSLSEKAKASAESSDQHVTQTAVTTEVKINTREESENAVQDSGPKDVQQEIQESKNDATNKEEEDRKPMQNTESDAVENELQESKHDNAGITEKPKEESKHKDDASAKEKPEIESEHNNISVTQQPRQERERDGTDGPEVESKHDNAEPHKQESKRDDAPPDQESKHEAVEGKEVQTHINGANNSPEIMVLAADSDGGATKPESSSEGKAGNVYN